MGRKLVRRACLEDLGRYYGDGHFVIAWGRGRAHKLFAVVY